MKPVDLRDHILETYLTLRVGMAVLAIALPFILFIGGYIRADLPLQKSMSIYYHSGGGTMRDEFVGILFIVGAFLYLYKGFTVLENYALNLAGVFVIGIALFPTKAEYTDFSSTFSLHGTLAVLFFLSIAYVCIFRASDTLSLISDQAVVKRFKRVYTLLGFGMITSPAVAVILSFILQPISESNPTIFIIEALGVIVFALYWFIKSREIAMTNSEQSALKGKLILRQHGVTDAFKQIAIERVEESPQQ